MNTNKSLAKYSPTLVKSDSRSLVPDEYIDGELVEDTTLSKRESHTLARSDADYLYWDVNLPKEPSTDPIDKALEFGFKSLWTAFLVAVVLAVTFAVFFGLLSASGLLGHIVPPPSPSTFIPAP